MKRPGRGAVAHGGICCGRLRERPGFTQQHDGIQRGVEAFDAIEAMLDQRARGLFAAADASGKFGGAEAVKDGVGVQKWCPWIACRHGWVHGNESTPCICFQAALRRRDGASIFDDTRGRPESAFVGASFDDKFDA